MLASEIAKEIEKLVQKHGDGNIFHEDNECNGYDLSEVFYDEREESISIR